MDHMLSCDMIHGMCTIEDLAEANDIELRFARHWHAGDGVMI